MLGKIVHRQRMILIDKKHQFSKNARCRAQREGDGKKYDSKFKRDGIATPCRHARKLGGSEGT